MMRCKILHSQPGDEVLAHVGANVRRLRLQSGLSQVALAEAAGISRRTLIGVEAGDANVSLTGLNRIAVALGVSFSEIVREHGSDPAQPIHALTWKGQSEISRSILLGSAPARHEAELWDWVMDVGEKYLAEADPKGWREMIYVVDGTLRITLSATPRTLGKGDFLVIDTSQPYEYENIGSDVLHFIRTVAY